MNWIDTNTLITICTGAIGLTQFILWKHIAKVKAYEAEKGKNLATKEDIGDITNEIKSVENKFINETEKLKCSLSILANIQTDIASMEKNSIIQVNKSLFIWLDSITTTPDLKNEESIDKHIQTQNDFYLKEKADEITFSLFVIDNELNKMLKEISLSLLKMQAQRQFLFIEIVNIGYEINRIKLEESSKEKREKLQKKIQERMDLLNKSQQNIQEKCITIVPTMNIFQQKCRDRIYKLLKSKQTPV